MKYLSRLPLKTKQAQFCLLVYAYFFNTLAGGLTVFCETMQNCEITPQLVNHKYL